MSDDRADADGDHEELPPSEAWEQFELHFRSYILASRRTRLNSALLDLEGMIEDGCRPTAEQIHEARDGLDEARALVEDVYAPVASGDVEPWDDGVGGMVPLAVLARQLDESAHGQPIADGGTDIEPTDEAEPETTTMTESDNIDPDSTDSDEHELPTEQRDTVFEAIETLSAHANSDNWDRQEPYVEVMRELLVLSERVEDEDLSDRLESIGLGLAQIEVATTDGFEYERVANDALAELAPIAVELAQPDE